MCEAQCSTQGPSHEASSLDMRLAIWKQRVRSVGSCFLLVRTLFFFEGPKLNSDSSKEKTKFVGPHHEK